MIRLVRIVGTLLIVAGALVVLAWFIDPLRAVWPWLLELPWPLRLGFSLAGLGLLVLFGSLLWERFEERESDRSLQDDP